MHFWPYKFELDNRFRAASELHVFLMVAVSLAFKTDLDSPLAANQWVPNSAISQKAYIQDIDDRKLRYDIMLVTTFLILIVAALLLTFVFKIRAVTSILTSYEKQDIVDSLHVRMGLAYGRFRLGLATDSDHKELQEFIEHIDANEHVRAGKACWRSKMLISHLDASELESTLTDLQNRLPKSETLGFHFTNMDACRLVLEESHGIRASNVGQLGGGVSICLHSLVGLGWTKGGGKNFCECVGRELWGSKWHEVMPPPAPQGAHADWGKYHCKLECVFVVRIPSEDHRDPARIVPGREGVYIVPPSQCIPGSASDDEYVYLSNQQIEACFVLKSPSTGPASDTLAQLARRERLVHVKIQSTRDSNGGMQDVAIEEVDTTASAMDVMMHNETQPWCPIVLSCVATVGKFSCDHATSTLRAHKQLQSKQSAKQVWPENVSRFTSAEMEAALRQIDTELMRPYSLAFFYTSENAAVQMCKNGPGVAASTQPDGTRGVRVSLQSPVDFGWPTIGGQDFHVRAGTQLWGKGWRDEHTTTSLDAVIVMGVPTSMIKLDKAQMWTIPRSLLAYASDDEAYYANAHIKKVYIIGKSSGSPVDHRVGKKYGDAVNPPVLPTARLGREPPVLPVEAVHRAGKMSGDALNPPVPTGLLREPPALPPPSTTRSGTPVSRCVVQD